LPTHSLSARIHHDAPFAQVPRRVFKAVKRLVSDLVEGEVKQESVATFSLYRWLGEFTRLASVA
jgi:hypothetical protein